MNDHAQQIEQVIIQKKKVESSLRTKSIAIAMIIFAITAFWIYFTSNQIVKLDKEKISLNNQIKTLKFRVDSIQSQFDSANLIGKYIKDDNDPYLIVKHLYGQRPKIADIVKDMLEYKNKGVKFGYNPDPGNNIFNSPSFIGYVYGINRLIPEASTIEELKMATEKVDIPKLGDLIFYPRGYVMMYLGTDGYSSEGCIGMTPWGVQILYTRFSEPIEYRRCKE